MSPSSAARTSYMGTFLLAWRGMIAPLAGDVRRPTSLRELVGVSARWHAAKTRTSAPPTKGTHT